MMLKIRDELINETYKEVAEYIKKYYIPDNRFSYEDINDMLSCEHPKFFDYLFEIHDSYSVDLLKLPKDTAPYIPPIPNNFCKLLSEFAAAKNMDVESCCRSAHISKNGVEKVVEGSFEPCKSAVLMLAFTLELDLENAKELLRTMAIRLYDYNEFDVTMEYFFKKGIYDLYIVNRVLHKLNLPMLGYYYV